MSQGIKRFSIVIFKNPHRHMIVFHENNVENLLYSILELSRESGNGLTRKECESFVQQILYDFKILGHPCDIRFDIVDAPKTQL